MDFGHRERKETDRRADGQKDRLITDGEMKGNKDRWIFGYRKRKAVERKTDGKTGEDADIEKNSQQKEGQTEKWTEEGKGEDRYLPDRKSREYLRGSITVPLASGFTGLDQHVSKIK